MTDSRQASSPATALLERSNSNLSGLDLGFYLYMQMCLLTTPDATLEQMTIHWNKEDPKSRSALKQIAYAVGDEAVRRKIH